MGQYSVFWYLIAVILFGGGITVVGRGGLLLESVAVMWIIDLSIGMTCLVDHTLQPKKAFFPGCAYSLLIIVSHVRFFFLFRWNVNETHKFEQSK